MSKGLRQRVTLELTQMLRERDQIRGALRRSHVETRKLQCRVRQLENLVKQLNEEVDFLVTQQAMQDPGQSLTDKELWG